MRKWLFIGGMIAVASLSLGFLLTKGPKDYAIPSQGFELPEYDLDEDIVRHIGYTASYNHGTLVPDWVAWKLSKAHACAGRASNAYSFNTSFSRDPDVKPPKASREDYSHSGWDKGHMAPRADMRWSQKALEESFYFTNVCPQNHTMNAGAWRKIEELCRNVATLYDQVYIVCGPIFKEHRFGTIGEAGVQVPDAFFKAVAVEVNGKMKTVGFLMDNTPQDFSPCHYAVSVDSVEKVIGRDLFPRGDEAAERSFDWEFWDR